MNGQFLRLQAQLAGAARESDTLSQGVRTAAATLSDHARRLRRSTDEFVEQLRREETAAA